MVSAAKRMRKHPRDDSCGISFPGGTRQTVDRHDRAENAGEAWASLWRLHHISADRKPICAMAHETETRGSVEHAQHMTIGRSLRSASPGSIPGAGPDDSDRKERETVARLSKADRIMHRDDRRFIFQACVCQYVRFSKDTDWKYIPGPVRFYRVACEHWRAHFERSMPTAGVKVQHVPGKLSARKVCKQDRTTYRPGSTPGASILDETSKKAPRDRTDRYTATVARYDALRAIPGAYEEKASR